MVGQCLLGGTVAMGGSLLSSLGSVSVGTIGYQPFHVQSGGLHCCSADSSIVELVDGRPVFPKSIELGRRSIVSRPSASLARRLRNECLEHLSRFVPRSGRRRTGGGGCRCVRSRAGRVSLDVLVACECVAHIESIIVSSQPIEQQMSVHLRLDQDQIDE